ncbi:hypothetical protein AWB78_03815 [Caballeronia calidae]|uniref:MalT-like TPR region domain-containing protein n=1 Tax=Caballeronia calidae TaxID=1777139 RepID=A0A158CDY4_9BURK|nr:hypothetical protein [Caballeronia calidae]SAK80512.1 hypothetical protein AWB78_03815 [Caballeronia calidae]
MQSWHPSNPVERRLMAVHDDWRRFRSDSRATLLYWQANEADQRILAAYIQRQHKLSNAVLQLISRFDDADQYPLALSQEIAAFYAVARETHIASVGQRQTPTADLLALTASLMHHHPDVLPDLVLILEPESICKPAQFERWLDELLGMIERDAWQAERLRIILTGTDTEPLWWLTKQRPHQVSVLHARYHMESLPRELVAESDERGPEADFRRLFVALNDTVTNGTPAQLETLRTQALTVTQRHAWFDQSVVVHLLAGAAYLKWNDAPRALSAYEAATQAGRQAIHADHSAGNKLVINGLFGEASVHWVQGDFRRAAERYTEAAQLAESDQDGLLAVEGWRMCSECFAQLTRAEPTIDAGLRALDAGAWIPSPMRANSNLQMVAQRMLGHMGILHRRRSELTSRLTALYGEDWPDTTKPLPADEVTQRFADEQRNHA